LRSSPSGGLAWSGSTPVDRLTCVITPGLNTDGLGTHQMLPPLRRGISPQLSDLFRLFWSRRWRWRSWALKAAQLGIGAFELLTLLVVLLDEGVDSLLEPFISRLSGGKADAK